MKNTLMSKKYDYIDPSTPVLMYYETYLKRKDLIALDGSTVPSRSVTGLRQIYGGNKLLTEPIEKLEGSGFTNPDIKLTVDRFHGLYLPKALFDDAITINNIGAVSNQWLTGDNNITHTHYFTVEFLKEPMVVNEYWMIAAVGEPEYIDREHPAPKSWVLKGKLRDETEWHVLSEHHERFNRWKPWRTRAFKVPQRQQKNVDMVRLEVTEWHESPYINSTGLKRFWMFGHKQHEFILPKIESPDPNYVYVVSRHKPPKED